MGLLSPLALALGLLAVPIIALYLLRLRRREQRISSTFLWRQVLRDLEANVPWQRLRPNMLLFLQLLALAAVVFALARPFLSRASQVQGDLFLLLDASASMQARDVAPSRFGVAQEEARALVDQLAPGNVASVILVRDVPELLVAQSADRAALRDAVGNALPASGGADLAAALSLAASLVQKGRTAQAVVLSDGNLPVAGALGPLPFGIRHQRIGTSGENLAVAAFSTRLSQNGLEALARIANYGPSAAESTLRLYLDNRLYDVRTLDLPPGGEAVERWAGLPEATVLEARLEPGDVFPLDDRAWALGSPSGRVRTLLVTEGNRFLAKALELHPAVEVTTTEPAALSTGGDYGPSSSSGQRLWVFDGFMPPVLPEGALLVLDPPLASAPWAGAEAGPVTGLRQRDGDLLRYVDLSGLHVLEAAPLRPPPDARVLLDSAEGPLLAVWQAPGQRIAAFGFDLHQSDLPLQPAFPILIQNLAGWLLPGLGQGLAVRPGEAVDVPLSPEAQAAWVETPEGERVQVLPPHPPQPFAVDGPGLYRVVQQVGGREQVTFFAANLFNPEESSLAPVSLPDLEARTGAGVGDTTFPWELAPWLALAALLVLSAEWWLYNRGR
ncbi:MAG: VWA domain-containing protein [Chloroflexi bacterium]|nr:VWA domain-containing protein [Chloroflexota bacterium]